MENFARRALCVCVALLTVSLETRVPNFYIGVNYLYWKAQQDRLQYATEYPGSVALDLFSSFFVDAVGCVKTPHFKGSSGVRLLAGYDLNDDWNIEFVWTHLDNRTSTTLPARSTYSYSAPLIFYFNPALAQQAAQSWHLRFNTFEWCARRTIELCPCFQLVPECGITAAWIDQCQNAQYTGIAIVGGGSQPFLIASGDVTIGNNFRAGGIHAGVDGLWNIWKKLSLNAGARLTLVPGKIAATYRSTLTPVPGGEDVPGTSTICESMRRMRSSLMCDIGLSVDNICSRYGTWSLIAKFEAQYWPNQLMAPSTRIQSFVGIWPGGSDLMLYGLTTGLVFHF